MKSTTTLLILFLCSFFCNAQSIKLFTTDRELSSSLINKIYQDKSGLIWISTEDGLNRYDGAKFTIYKNDPDNEYSLQHNFVRSIFEDNSGHLLIGCYNGLQLYIPSEDRFSKPAKKEDGTTFFSNIGMMIQRKNGSILLSGNQISEVFIDGEELTVKPLVLPVDITITDYLLEDREENLWVVKDENKIYRFATDGTYKEFTIRKEALTITAIGQDATGNVYAGTISNGLFVFDKNNNRFRPVTDKASDSSMPVKSLFLANQDEIYISTDGQGLRIYNTRTKEITNSRFDNSYFDLADSKVHNVIKDNAGNFWLAIFQKGVMMIPAISNRFKYIGHKSINKNIIGSCAITALLQDKKGIIWVATDNDGLYSINPDGSKGVHFKSNGEKNSIPNIIISIFEDSEDNLWVGSFTSGMCKVNRKTGKCTYLNDLTDDKGKSFPRVYTMVEDNHKRLWIATMGGGLFYHDLISGKTVMPKHIEVDKWINSLQYTEDNKLLVGTYWGVTIVDLDNPEIKYEHILSKHIINTIYKKPGDATIWIGTSDGLAKWNQYTAKITKYTTKEGMPSNVIYSIQEDNSDNLWISTDAGLSLFNPESGKVINYFVGDGLQGNEFCRNSSFKDNNGTLWFGGINGITYFNPQEITNPAKKWTVQITDFYLHNTPVRAGMKSGNHNIIEKSVFDAREFNLSHKDNSFTVEFATREFNSPERISYTYSLNESEWVELRPGINRVSFNNLPADNYCFRVRAIDYNMMSEIEEIYINISPAWYASSMARLGYLVIFIIIIYLVIIQIRHRYKVKHQILEHKHAEEINEAKLQFFINISHEIRTPMSLISSPLQQLMTNDKDQERQRIYRTIFRNSERILNLINQLMDIRKIDKGQMSLKFQENNIVSFVSDLFYSFETQAANKQIKMNFSSETDDISLWIDPNNFDKIIINILSNAFKFTPANGEISVSISKGLSAELGDYAQICISDTGIGINESDKERIFERFYQIHNSLNNSNVGTGIGLHLTRSLVELHHGSITAVNNTPERGSKFTIRIPLGKRHLKNEEIETDISIIGSKYHCDMKTVTDMCPEEEKPQRSKSKFRIVIVEDDEEIRNYLTRELSFDYHVTECRNGKEALTVILQKQPSLIISDVMMPEMDGLTMCRKIKQNVNINHIPVILLTAKTQDEDNLDGLNVGADAYLTKPFNIDILKKTVSNIIKSREMLRNCFSGNQEQEVKKPVFEMQSTDNKLLDRIMNVINRNLSNQDLNVEMITSEVGISRVHLHRKLKELTNQSTRDLIRNVRLKQAANMLLNTDYNISEVADMTGFSSVTLFSRSFKDLYGVTPSEYTSTKEKKTVSIDDIL